MVGERIKAYLAENGIKQSFISEKTGYSCAILSKMFAGNRKITVEDYYLICKALRVPLNYFLED